MGRTSTRSARSEGFRYTEPVAVSLLYICLILHCLGYNTLVDSILMAVVSAYLGIDLYKKRA